MKLTGSVAIELSIKINYNMRCIETFSNGKTAVANNEINYNMRCIETRVAAIVVYCIEDKLQHEMY